MAVQPPQHLFDLESSWRAPAFDRPLDPVPDWFDRGIRRAIPASLRGTTAAFRPRLLNVWFFFVGAVLLVFAGRALQLQFFSGQYFRTVAEGNRIRIHDIKAQRGIFYDRNAKQLVENVPSFSLALVPVDIPRDATERSDLFNRVAELAGIDAQTLTAQLEAVPSFSYQPVIVAEHVRHETAIAATIAAGKMPAIRVLAEQTRHYLPVEPGSSSGFSHLFGYVSRMHADEVEQYLARDYSLDDFVGRAGLEATYEEILKGKNGKEQVEVEASGKPKETIARTEPIDGQSIQLAIDLDLQRAAEYALSKALGASQTYRGSVVVLDPRNGEVLALVSLPGFDINQFARGIPAADFAALLADPNRPLFSRAVSGEYPPGSTFKLVVGAAGIEEGTITPASTVVSSGGLYVGNWFFPDWKPGGHGITNLSKALAQSVNTFFYTVGGGYGSQRGLGIGPLVEYAKKFGIGERLGIDLPQEADGFVPTESWKQEQKNEPWYIGDTYHFAIGQGDVLVTPLHVAAWTSVFANGGTLYQPKLALATVDSAANVVSRNQPVILRSPVVGQKAIDAVNAGLREAALSGSARRFASLPFPVWAKTGTAQWSSRAKTHAWVTSYAAPTANQPAELVVTVLIEEGGEGSSTAVPVAYEIYQWWADHRVRSAN